jgi:hypothetical protein
MIENRIFVDVRAFVLSLLLITPTAVLAEVDAPLPRDKVLLNYHHFHHVSEAVQMQLGVRSPSEAIPGNTIITHDWTVRDADGEIVGQFRTESPAAGFAEVTFAVSVAGDDGNYNLFANDQRLGPVAFDPKFDRVSYKIEVERSATGRNPQTGGPIQIKAKTIPYAASAIIDKFTGATKATTYLQYELSDVLVSSYQTGGIVEH